MTSRQERKFNPEHASRLDAPERDRYLPPDRLIAALRLNGGETALDYGAGTGRLTVPLAAAVGERGRVIAVDESDVMLERLHEKVDPLANVEVLAITDNHVALPDHSVDAILAVNILHEIRGETALSEMLRLLAPAGRLLVADWRKGTPDRPEGPPDRILYDAAEATLELQRAGFQVSDVGALPYHYLLLATPGPANP